MRFVSGLAVVAVMTVLLAVLVKGDGPNSGGTIFSWSRGNGINRNDLPFLAAWAVGVAAAVVVYLVRAPGVHLTAVIVVLGIPTLMLAVLLSGHGSGSVGTLSDISAQHGANAHALPFIGAWGTAMLATWVLHSHR